MDRIPMCFCDILIVGGGAAGLTAACALHREDPGLNIILAERAEYLGGVLRQCTHRGFGLAYFKENLTGQEYADRLEAKIRETSVDIRLNTEVVKIGTTESACSDAGVSEKDSLSEGDRFAWLAGPRGREKVRFQTLILASGCRERAIGSLGVYGTRPSGVFGAASFSE